MQVGIQKAIATEDEQLRMITMKEITEMPVENLRNLFNQKNVVKQRMIKRFFMKMKRFEDKYLDSIESVKEKEGGYSLEFKKNFNPSQIIDFTYNLTQGT